eukprot:snap_masked-scaffold_4-processed-gene-9.36-mRNA-1 protein AED:1.00 eAED:1.00 QI:0/0/0/0/1/1/2/0/295
MPLLKRVAEEAGCTIFLGEPCGNNGICINASCVCEVGWFSSRDFYSSKSSPPCVSNVVLLQVFYITSIILHMLGFYMTIKRLKKIKHLKRVAPFLIQIIAFLLVSIIKSTYLKTVFLGFDPTVSIPFVFGVVLAFFSFSIYYARVLTYLKNSDIIRKNSRNVRSIKLGMIAFNVIPKLSIVFCIPLVATSLVDFSKEAEEKLFITYIWGVLILYNIAKLLDSHSKTHGITTETKKMQNVLLRLQNARLLYTSMFFVVCTQYFIAILSVEYVLYQYTFPVALCLTAFSYLFQRRAS